YGDRDRDPARRLPPPPTSANHGSLCDRPLPFLPRSPPRVRQGFVLADEPVHFVLPAFPVKSPSRRKTFGPLPDLAEELALSFLQSVCDEVADVHRPGAKITICSDGRV